MADFKISGVEQVLAALRQFPKNVERKIARTGMRAGAKIIQKATKDTAPFGKTGQLKKNVIVRAMKKSRRWFGIRVTIGAGDFVGKQWYAAVVEYGSSKMPAQHYMRTAYDLKKQEAADASIEEMEPLIQEAIKESSR